MGTPKYTFPFERQNSVLVYVLKMSIFVLQATEEELDSCRAVALALQVEVQTTPCTA